MLGNIVDRHAAPDHSQTKFFFVQLSFVDKVFWWVMQFHKLFFHQYRHRHEVDRQYHDEMTRQSDQLHWYGEDKISYLTDHDDEY